MYSIWTDANPSIELNVLSTHRLFQCCMVHARYHLREKNALFMSRNELSTAHATAEYLDSGMNGRNGLALRLLAIEVNIK